MKKANLGAWLLDEVKIWRVMSLVDQFARNRSDPCGNTHFLGKFIFYENYGPNLYCVGLKNYQ